MYVLEFFKFLVDFRLDEVEDVGGAVVLSGDGVELVKRAHGQEADEEGGEEDSFHLNKLMTIKLVTINKI